MLGMGSPCPLLCTLLKAHFGREWLFLNFCLAGGFPKALPLPELPEG